ncbi:MAG: tRNA (guanosine(37)-N1)-methyltransferase TrmD [Flavobacteriales bacterium]|nr:tRNA (guanine-N(1)-)-methyltransferase [Flavobacteriales bacterium]MCC6577835.1 tRNA (guanosine(37)-N1)-methyltransferase TrmD [Flavobacteriales bacterium]NUQ15512.1 tRNA (guanosine(37)-N1)-methyltransferase TrmD [Flavobacteriales bacterium]
MVRLRIDILSAVPRLLDSWFAESILQRAQQKGLVEVVVHDLRQWSTDKHRRIDDYVFGGGAGMVLQVEPIHRAITQLKGERPYDAVIYLSPDGELLDQPLANRLSVHRNLILLCGHYKGVDERVRTHLVDLEVSIGNYVLSGGELGAAVLSDALIRLVPGVLSDETSALSDSFQDGLVAPPVYTRPAVYGDWKVPDILLSGHEARIAEWRHQQAVERTRERRPELLEGGGDGTGTFGEG